MQSIILDELFEGNTKLNETYANDAIHLWHNSAQNLHFLQKCRGKFFSPLTWYSISGHLLIN